MAVMTCLRLDRPRTSESAPPPLHGRLRIAGAARRADRRRLRRPLAVAVIAQAALASMVPGASAQTGWNGPQRLTGSVWLSYPRAAVNSRGDALVAWRSSDGRVRVARRHAGDRRFGATQVVARGTGDSYEGNLDVVLAADGTAVVAWAQRAARSPRYRIVAVRCRGTRPCGPARSVGASTTMLRALPTLALGRRGEIWLGWRRDDVPLRLARLPAGSTRFGPPLSPVRTRLGNVAWALAPDGRLVVVGDASGPDGPYVVLAAGRARGPLTRFEAISPSGRSAPALAVAPNGAVAVAFVVGSADESGPARGPVEVATAPPGSPYAISAPRAVTAPGVIGSALRLAAGPHGAAALAWGGTGGGWPGMNAETIFAWMSTRAPAAPFGLAEPLAAPGAWTGAPSVAVDGRGAVTSSVAFQAGAAIALSVRHEGAGAAAGASKVLATTAWAGDVHIAWFSPSSASAGDHSIVAWPRGPRGPIVVFARDRE